MTRRERRHRCPAARSINADLHRDKMQSWYDRTHSYRALVALELAARKALKFGPVCPLGTRIEIERRAG